MAASEQISIVMQVIDKVTAVNDKIKGSLGSVSESIKKNEEMIKGVGVVSGAVFAGLSFVLGKSVSEAMEAQRVNAQLEAVLRSTNNAVGLTSETIKQYASQLQNSTGIADDVIGQGQNMLLTFTNIGGEVFPKATETLLDMATAMNGGAAPSAEALKGSAIQLGKALNDPIEGISALSRVGVTFTEQQKAQIEQMVKMGDTAGAQKMILAELNREFGGSAAAQAATFEGRMRIMKETLNGVFETIGTALLPVMTTLLQKITPIIQTIAGWIENNPKLSATIIAVVAGVSGFIAAASGLALIIGPITTALGILGTVIGVLTGPVGLVIAAIVALGIAWKTNFLGIQDITATAWQFIKDGFAAFKALFSGDIEGFTTKIAELMQNLFNNIKNRFPDFFASFSELWQKVEDITVKILVRIAVFVTEKALMISNALQKMKDTLVEIATLGAANTKTYNPEATGGGTPPPRAFGGNVRAGQVYEVGENGRELYVPASNGRIYSNKEMQSMGGGTVNINFGGVTISNEADEDRLIDKISQALGRQYRLSQSNINT